MAAANNAILDGLSLALLAAAGSMHMIFSPSDAKQVIEKGWDESHPRRGRSHGPVPMRPRP